MKKTPSSYLTYLYTVLGLVISVNCLAQEPKPEYSIKEDGPRIGSSIRRNAMTDLPIAANKRYGNLSAVDRAKLHSWWESIPDGDEPPFPAEGLKPLYEAMIKAQEVLQVEGRLDLIATVNPGGAVVEVKTIGSPSAEMTKFAAGVVVMTKFKPAVCSGKPCQMDFPLRYEFAIQ